ncbi:hypothetical protein Bpfe_013412 [Biomphalaria pfeifferi]|uniref:Uncharacterized protein n=1 Tax=Biomphalaria pfeifferi TaxID=112525 RepID=A0AAD8FAU7_BIOPF|nr:hypothetical protein Bpfe_013412 [Biomphalaria pfeifferi]
MVFFECCHLVKKSSTCRRRVIPVCDSDARMDMELGPPEVKSRTAPNSPRPAKLRPNRISLVLSHWDSFYKTCVIGTDQWLLFSHACFVFK